MNSIIEITKTWDSESKLESDKKWTSLNIIGYRYYRIQGIEMTEVYRGSCMNSPIKSDTIQIGSCYIVSGIHVSVNDEGKKFDNFKGISNKPVPDDFELE